MVDIIPQRSGFGLAVERYGPLAFALATMVAIYLNSTSILEQFVTDKWQTSNLYSAIFNWSAIQTGFAFGVYGFVAGRSEGFIEAIRETVAMKRFLGYVKRANIGGFVLTIMSLPLTITNPAPGPVDSWQFYGVLGWFGLFVWTFVAFFRIAYSFGHLSSVRDQPAFYGA
jgi:hypothetical protein